MEGDWCAQVHMCFAWRGETNIEIGANIYRIVCVRRNVGNGKVFRTSEHTHRRPGTIFYRVLQTIFIPLELAARIECQATGVQFEIRLFERGGDGKVCTNFTIGKSVDEIDE